MQINTGVGAERQTELSGILGYLDPKNTQLGDESNRAFLRAMNEVQLKDTTATPSLTNDLENPFRKALSILGTFSIPTLQITPLDLVRVGKIGLIGGIALASVVDTKQVVTTPVSEGYVNEQPNNLQITGTNQELEQKIQQLFPGDDEYSRWGALRYRTNAEFLKRNPTAQIPDLVNIFFGLPKSASFTSTPSQTLDDDSFLSYTTNWSGWGILGGPYTRVQGLFRTPILNCLINQQGDVAAWFGTYGLTEGAVDQAGVATSCFNSQQIITIWGELYPDPSFNLKGRMRIKPGDPIGVRVTELGGNPSKVEVEIKNLRNKDYAHATKSRTHYSSNSMAVAITETHNGQIPSFEEIDYSRISVTYFGLTTTFINTPGTRGQYYLVDDIGNILVQPSALTTSGDGFTVTNMVH